VDDRVHAADPVDLVRDAPGLDCAAEITEHDTRGARGELAKGRRVFRSGVQHHLMTIN
jgi:hypothetical protein